MDSARDRIATRAVAVQFAVNGAFSASFMPRLPELRDEIGIGTAALGILLTVASGFGLVSSATCKRVIARFGTQRVLLTGGVVTSVALMLVGLSSSWPMALAALAAMCVFDVYVDVAMNMQGSWLSARRTRPMMNRLHGLWALGSVIGGLTAARLASSRVSLTTHLVVAAAVLLVISTIVATQLLPIDEVHADTPHPGREDTGDSIRRRPPMTWLFVAGLTAVVIEIAALNWAAFRVSDDLGGPASTAALAYVAVMGGMTITRFAGDHLAHRFGADRFTTGSAVLAVSSLVAAALIDDQALAIVAFLVAGLGIATLAPRLYDLAARAGGGTAAGLGVLTAGIRLATIVTPVTIAALSTRTSVGTAIAAVSLAAGLPFIVAIRSGRTVRRG